MDQSWSRNLLDSNDSVHNIELRLVLALQVQKRIRHASRASSQCRNAAPTSCQLEQRRRLCNGAAVAAWIAVPPSGCSRLTQSIEYSSFRSDVACTDNRRCTIDRHPCQSDASRWQNICFADEPAGGHQPHPLSFCFYSPPPCTPSTPLRADMDSGNTTTIFAPSEASPNANTQKLDLGAVLLGCVIQAMYVVA